MKRFFLACLTGLTLATSAHAGVLDSWASYMWKTDLPRPPTIKVLIAKNKSGVLLEVKGKYKLYDPNTMEHLSTRFIGKRKYIQTLSSGLKWGEEFPGIFQLLIVPDEGKTTTLVDGIEYSGILAIYDVGGKISVVNEVSIETYLDSVVSSKLSAGMTEETLGALTIANRTQAYYLANHPKTDYWAVDAAKTGYEGFAATNRQNGVDKALASTKYMVLTQEGKPFDANWEESKIALGDANRLASQGENAAQILKKAFPSAALKVMLSNTR